MVLQSLIIVVSLLFGFYELKSEDLNALLNNMAKAKTVGGVVEPITFPGAQPIQPVAQPNQLATQPSPLPSPVTAQPKLPEPMPLQSAATPSSPMEPKSVMPEPGQPMVTQAPKQPMPMPTPGEPKAALPGLEEPKTFGAPKLPMPAVAEPKAIMPASVEPNAFVSQPVPMRTPAVAITPPMPMSEPMVQPMFNPMITTSQPVPAPAPEVAETVDVTSAGLDTLNIDSGGNWLEKRIWYKKAEHAYEEIHTSVQKASDIRSKFVHEVSVIGKHIDDFYEKISFEKGQIDELLQAVLGSLTTEQKIRGGDLSSDERSIQEKIHADQQALQSIETTVKAISDLDEQVSKTMIKAFQEIDACSALETKAWNNFKEIGLILDDKKARVLYYEIENFHKNIEKKIDYLKSNLLPYLQNQLSSKITQQTNQIQTTVDALKSKGLNLEELLKKDAAGDFEIFKQREEMKIKQEAEKLAKSQAKGSESLDASKGKKSSSGSTAWYEDVWCMMLQYLCPILNKLSEWASIFVCCVQTVLCKIQELICRLFGY